MSLITWQDGFQRTTERECKCINILKGRKVHLWSQNWQKHEIPGWWGTHQCRMFTFRSLSSCLKQKLFGAKFYWLNTIVQSFSYFILDLYKAKIILAGGRVGTVAWTFCPSWMAIVCLTIQPYKRSFSVECFICF